MELRLKKQPQKYLQSVDERTRKKLWKALENVRNLRGNINRLEGFPNRYRYKMDHYRIVLIGRRGKL